MNIFVTKATREDTKAVIDIFLTARACMTYLPHIHTDEETREYLTNLVLEGNVFVAKKEERVVGFSQLKNNWIHHLYVSPPFQNQGVGTALLSHMKKINPLLLLLWVFEDNKRAISFYEREGFVLEEKRGKEKADNEEKLPDRRYVWRNSGALF